MDQSQNLDEWSDEDFYTQLSAEDTTIGQVDSSDSEENMPLAFLKNTKKRTRRRLITDDGSELDDSNDENYLPSHSTSSETDQDSHERKRKKQIRLPRDKNWKKRPAKMKTERNKLNTSSKKSQHGASKAKQLRDKILLMQSKRRKSSVSDIDRAKTSSKRIATVKGIIRKAHSSRLDSLLASNELQRVVIYGDGNCFFTAVKLSSGIREGTIEMRSKICDFMISNSDKYARFWANKTDINSDFNDEVEQLRISGTWNTSMADLIPLAFADCYGSILRVYTSTIATPVIEIKPDKKTEEIISIAYMAVRGEEHYDATTRIMSDTAPGRQDNTNEERTNSATQSISSRQESTDDEETVQTPTKFSSTHSADHDSTATPHKRANYKSPEKQLSSRKRKRHPEKWKKNVRKALRTQGKQYVSVSGQVQAAKSVKPHDCGKCRFKCSEKFSDEDRESLFSFYYNLGNFERQRQFLCEMVDRVDSSRKGKGKRQISQKYHLVKNDKRVRVCRDFFLRTLDIKRKTVDYNLSKKKHGSFGGQDMRGRHKAPNKTDDAKILFVKRHIESFPRMESHYSRKTTKKEYLEHDLNIKKMWKLYCDVCVKEGKVPVSEAIYRKIFCENFNLAFYKPKKDQCSLCALYTKKRAAGTVDESLEKEYNAHQEEKHKARQEKMADKERAKTEKSVYVATFDMQAVLTTPCSLVSELYYSRKLCCYNLTVYSLGDKQVYCHLWDETQGKRGSCEIATCLLKNTMTTCQSPDIKNIVYYSDSCGGQNRNQYVMASHLYAISQQPQLQSISHKFLASGHSQMECDSVHASIETTKKITQVFVPSQWCTLVALSRKQNPYIAVPMKFSHVVDFKAFVKKYCRNLKTTTTGIRINWLNVKWFEVRQSNPRSIFVNYTFEQDNFQEIQVQVSTRKRAGRTHKWPENFTELDLCYTSKLPISVAKKRDLIRLCEKEIIPEEFHAYYASLPESQSEKDYVPFETEDEDTDVD